MPIKWVSEGEPLRDSAGINLLIHTSKNRIEQLNNKADYCFDVEELLAINREISRLENMITKWKKELQRE